MLKGAGTEFSPLLARTVEFMDMSFAVDSETKEKGFIVIIRDVDSDELYAMQFRLPDMKEMVEKGTLIFEALE